MIHLRRLLQPTTALAVVAAVFIPAAAAGAPPAAASLPPSSPPPPSVAAPNSPPTLSLQDALDQAENQSLQLKLAALRVPRAQLALDRARSVAATGGQGLARALEQRHGIPLPADTEGAVALRRSAELGVEQAALSVEVARQGTRLAVVRAYVEWQKATALADAQQAALIRARAQADSARAALQAGSAARYDVIQATAQVSAQEAALVAAEAGREVARLTLERTIGAAVPPGLRPAGELPGGDAADLPGAQAGAESEADAEEQVARALNRRADATIARLNATARGADLDLLSRSLPEGDPLLATARLSVQEAALQLESTLADIRLQVRQARLGVSSARERLRALQAAAAQAREALNLAQLRFDAGAATTVELLGTQAALSQAEASRIQAAADLAAARAMLQQAGGEL